MKTDYILRCLIVLFSLLMSQTFSLFSELALFPTISYSVSTLEICTNDQTVCTLPINIESKTLVNEPAI